VGATSDIYVGTVDCKQPTPIPAKSFATSQLCHDLARHSVRTLPTSITQYVNIATFLPYLLDRKGKVTIPMIWPQDMIELHPLSIGDARAGFPVLATVVAKRETNPVFAMILAFILEEV
jgi:hypothetical protein